MQRESATNRYDITYHYKSGETETFYDIPFYHGGNIDAFIVAVMASVKSVYKITYVEVQNG